MDDAATPFPTPAELSDGVDRLLAEVHEAFTSDRWAILDSGRERAKWLVYDGAALRYCCQLLREMEVSAGLGLEFAVRTLGRAHMEAWLLSLYIHFGGYPAVVRVGQDARYSLEGLDREAKAFNEQLAEQKEAALRRTDKVRRANEGITRRNRERVAGTPETPLLDVPHVPRLEPNIVDLSALIAGFDPHAARKLSVSEIVDTLTMWAPRLGFGNESFRPVYLIYRWLSTVGTHATMHILDSYVDYGTGKSWFVRIAPETTTGSAIDSTLATTLYATAFAAEWVLSAQGCPTEVSSEIRTWLAPDPTGRSAWSPGTPAS
ncbi:hypothetical protein [Streptomyces sp. NPDC006739]|uniref:hypothetical protein n=1 Tax=Streptomyces sp. NPDC006739 TaxID=3364763 RepID=UPI0036A63D4C